MVNYTRETGLSHGAPFLTWNQDHAQRGRTRTRTRTRTPPPRTSEPFLPRFCRVTSKAGVALTVTINRVLYQSRELLEKLKWRATFKCTATGKQAPSLWQEGFPQSLGPSGFPGSNNLSQAVMTKDFQKSCTQQPAVHFHSMDHLRGQGSSRQLCIQRQKCILNV